MPYQSDKQRRWAHTDSAKKAGFPTEEFDKASKGMAEGGVVSPYPSDPHMVEETNEERHPEANDPEFERSSDYPTSAMTEMPPEIMAALSMLGAPAAASAGEEGLGALKGLGEAGEVTLGRNAPKMEGMAEEVGSKLEPYIKGIQKGYKGSPDVEIWSVKGDPAEIAKLGYGPNPGSIPKNILQEKGLLPQSVEIPEQNAPNAFAHGGVVKDHLTQKYGTPQPAVSMSQDKAAFKPGGFPIDPKSKLSEAPKGGYADGGPVYAEGDPQAGQPLTFDKNAGLPPVQDTDFMKQLQAGTTDMGSVPPAAPSQLSNYIGQQKQQIGQYGPEQQLAVQQQLQQQRQGLGAKLPVAAGNFADALMQGVARAGNPGFGPQIQGQQNKLAEEKLGVMEKAGPQNMAQTEAKMKLDAMNPDSALSTSKREQNEPILVAMGFNPKTVAAMSASEMDTAINTLKDVGLKDREIMVKRMEMEIKLKEQYETSRHNVAEEGLKGQEVGATAAKELATLPGATRLENKIPGSVGEAAQKKLENVAGLNHGIPDLGATFNGQKVIGVRKIQ